jgi:SAM-dependent methyltransferase
MSESDSVFAGSVPDVYDEHLAPLIFETYARDLANRTALFAPDAVLEVAAGSGVATRAVAPVLGAGGRFAVTDLNEPMLERAASRQPDSDSIEWRVADALDLPFADQTFDLVLCQFGAMFFPDRVKAYSEARRVLRPGGRFIFSMWDRIEENEFAHAVTRALSNVYPQDPPRFLLRTPHGHYDPGVYQAELGAGGFDDVEVDAVAAVSEATSAEVPAIAYCQGTPLRNEIEARNPPDLGEATGAATEELRLQFGDEEIQGRISAYIITASRANKA